MICIKHFTRMLEQHLKMKFAKLKISLYVSKRKKQMHMGLDILLFSFVRHDQLTKEIKKFQMLSYDIEKKFKFLFLQSIGSTKWKYDYIIMKKRVV